MVLWLAGALSALLCSRPAFAGEVIYTAQPYSFHGVTINAQKIFLKGNKLWLRLLVINGTGKLLTMDKTQMQGRLQSGAVIPREAGVFGKYAKPNIINPGLSHELNIEFTIGPVPQPLSLILRQGLIVDGKSLPLPDYPVRPIGS
jgi:hypothetical protein